MRKLPRACLLQDFAFEGTDEDLERVRPPVSLDGLDSLLEFVGQLIQMGRTEA